jgi:DNA-binding LacI/PurR family transcriptional regulator
VGKDLAVVGYDGTEDAVHSQPPLTTLQQPVYDTAKRLVDMLVACINGEPMEESQVILARQLIIRDSTGG